TNSDAAIRLFNADGSEPEISGNGTRCAAALMFESGMIDSGRASDQVTIHTGAGPKHLRLLRREGRRFWFEMDMGSPKFLPEEIRAQIPLRSGLKEVTILDVGNPQCVVFVDEFPLDWETLGAEIEGHPRFPKRSNVSFVRVIDPHAI